METPGNEDSANHCATVPPCVAINAATTATLLLHRCFHVITGSELLHQARGIHPSVFSILFIPSTANYQNSFHGCSPRFFLHRVQCAFSLYNLEILNSCLLCSGDPAQLIVLCSGGVGFKWFVVIMELWKYKHTHTHAQVCAGGMRCRNAAAPVFLDAVLLRHGSVVFLTAAIKHQRVFETGLGHAFVRLVWIQALGDNAWHQVKATICAQRPLHSPVH